MAKKGFLLGMLALALVFGFALAGCKNDDGGSVANKLTITGITSATGDIAVMLMTSDEKGELVAEGIGTIQNQNVTISLKSSGNDWTGTGSYYIVVDLIYSTVDKITFSTETTTVEWSKFRLFDE
jgi:hypothetical protein